MCWRITVGLYFSATNNPTQSWLQLFTKVTKVISRIKRKQSLFVLGFFCFLSFVFFLKATTTKKQQHVEISLIQPHHRIQAVAWYNCVGTNRAVSSNEIKVAHNLWREKKKPKRCWTQWHTECQRNTTSQSGILHGISLRRWWLFPFRQKNKTLHQFNFNTEGAHGTSKPETWRSFYDKPLLRCNHQKYQVFFPKL